MPARLDQLTSLRFFAALAVLASHLWPLAEEPNALQPLARTLFHEGYAGVSFFFMLSGFILAHTYQRKLSDGAISRGKYLALRLARIVPLHWLTALPFALWLLAGEGARALPKVAVNLALLQSWVPRDGWYFTLNEPSWSLSDELFFYAAFAVLAFWPWRKLAMAAGLLLAVDIGMVAWRIASGQGAILAGEGNTLTHWLTYIDPPMRLLDFMAGMLLYRCPRLDLSGWRASVLELGSVGLLLGVMAACPLLGVPDALRMQLVYLLPMALVIWSFAQGGGALSRGLAGSRRLVLLGDASFALYLVHLPVIHAGIAFQDRRDEPWPWLPWAGVVSAVAILLSLGVFLWIETPGLKHLRRWIDRRFPF